MPDIPGITISDKLAVGRTSTVYCGSNASGQQVAVKVLNACDAIEPRVVQRFYAAAKAAMLADHPRVLDVQHVTEAEGRHFQQMEYLPGGTLAAHLVGNGSLPESLALRLIVCLAEALDVVHATGFVHRAVDPASVLLTASQEPVLGRFGLVYNHAGREDLTDLWGCSGALAYVAPQQLRCFVDAHPTDDIYSLGVLLYECLTGRVPFIGYALEAAIQQKHQIAVATLPGIRAMSQGVADLVFRCLEPERSKRFQSAFQLAVAASGILGKSVSDFWKTPSKFAGTEFDREAIWYLLRPTRDGGLRMTKTTAGDISLRILRGRLREEVLVSPRLDADFRPLHRCNGFRHLFR